MGANIRHLMDEFQNNISQKCAYSVIQFCDLAEGLLHIQWQHKIGKRMVSWYFVEIPEYRQLHDIAGGPAEFIWRISACATKRTTVSVQRRDHLHVDVQHA